MLLLRICVTFCHLTTRRKHCGSATSIKQLLRVDISVVGLVGTIHIMIMIIGIINYVCTGYVLSKEATRRFVEEG